MNHFTVELRCDVTMQCVCVCVCACACVCVCVCVCVRVCGIVSTDLPLTSSDFTGLTYYYIVLLLSANLWICSAQMHSY